MKLSTIRENSNKADNNKISVELTQGYTVEYYPRSFNEKGTIAFLIALKDIEKSLFLLSPEDDSSLLNEFEGELLTGSKIEGIKLIKKCALNGHNSESIQKHFEFTKPIVIGLVNSFGFGDRLGLANAGHIRSLAGYDFKPIFAQQSIRELTRTQRKPNEVMDAAVWAVFQEGYKEGYGADADHLKTTEDIDLMMKAGYKTFTIDPGEHVVNEADVLSESELEKQAGNLPWKDLNDSISSMTGRYVGKGLKIADDFEIKVEKNDMLKALVKYGKALAHIKKMSDHINQNYSNISSELEVSVDETDSVTSPFEHFFIANELKRMNVAFVSLAPRFVGDFEKGIDYKGDLIVFKNEYSNHLKITNYFGTYKISLHSGSDKFSVYKVIGGMHSGFVHVKTAGTSYLEALKVVATKDTALFREILDYSTGLYEIEKKSYHVSADINKVKKADKYSDNELKELFSINDIRQILHVTYGRVLTDKNDSGKYIFREKIYKCLAENEDLHYEYLIKHFHRHLDPFKD